MGNRKTNLRFLQYLTIISAHLLLISNLVFSQENSGDELMTKEWTNLKYAIYFTHGDIERLLADTTAFKETMEYFAPIKAKHVYLEGRSNGDIDIQLLKTVVDRFKSIGIKTTGAMVPVSPKGGPACYNNPEDLASIEKRMQQLAKVFDNIILDDWLFTTCTCEKCITERGKQSWADYRTKLLVKQSKKYIIDAARKVNPNVKVIIKYPNWYEGHRQNGYDVYNETMQFDKIAVGIESRITENQDQHIPIFSGYIFQKWWSGIDKSKWVGSWLDNYGMTGGSNYYNAQVCQAVLAKSPEIILWCAGQLWPSNPSSDVYPNFVEMLPEFERVAELIKGDSRGIPIYLPYGSTGEYNIFGYLGMIGIPLEPIAYFPNENQNAIFTLHSLQDIQLGEKMIRRLKDGNDVFMTWNLWLKMQDTEFKNAISLVDYGGKISSSQFRLRNGWNEEIVKSDKPFSFDRLQTTTWPYVRDVALIQEDYDYGIFLKAQYLKGTIYILNMPDNEYDLLRLPFQVLNKIRSAFAKELAVTLNGPGSVSLYLYGQKQYVLYNLSDQSSSVSLKFNKKVALEGWKELVKDKSLSVKVNNSNEQDDITEVSLDLNPYELVIVQEP
jgi:hypothetical protein